MKYLIPLLLICSIAAAETPGQLQQIQGLSAEANSLSTEAPGLTSTISNAKTTETNAVKEGTVYLEDQKQKVAAITAAENNILATVYHPAIDPLNAESSRYTAQCVRTFNRETEMAQYNACVQWKSNLDGRLQSFNTWWANYQVEWNAKNVEPVNAVIRQQNVRLEVLRGQLAQAQAADERATKRMAYVRQRIAQITGIIGGFCHSENLTGEAMKWCTNVDWDGASRKLPPLTTSGTGGITPNN